MGDNKLVDIIYIYSLPPRVYYIHLAESRDELRGHEQRNEISDSVSPANLIIN
jgi:hypothetical protein